MSTTTRRTDRAARGIRRIEVDGITLRLRDTGAPAGASDALPLLVYNGSAADLEVIDPLVDALSPHRRVLAFDQPGMGRSPAVFPTLTIPQLADLGARVLDLLGVERADVLGYSFGGAVAQQLALTAPRRVRKLVLVASVYGLGGIPTDPFTTAAVIAHQSPTPTPPGMRALARLGYGGVVKTDDTALEAFERAVAAAPPDLNSFLGQALAAGTWSSLPWLWAITTPTLVLSGDDDLIVPVANAVVLATWIPRARLRVLTGAGHLMVLDQTDDVAREISAFLA